MAPALPDSPAPWRHRLSTRIVALSAIAWALVLAMVGGTLWLSWQLEGAGAAINDAGSLRMRATRTYVELSGVGTEPRRQLAVELDAIDGTLARLRRGDPSRPSFCRTPPSSSISSTSSPIAGTPCCARSPPAR